MISPIKDSFSDTGSTAMWGRFFCRHFPGTGSDKLIYQIADHLGSVRVIKDGNGDVLQRFDYYPFGGESRVWTAGTSTPQSALRYRFGGKEIAGQKVGASALAGIPAAAAGSPYLDFGARLYDPRTAAWLSQDPMAEKYYPISPYVYCTGNPVNLVDPEGKEIWIILQEDENRFQLQYEFGTLFNPDGSIYEGNNSFALTILSTLTSLDNLNDPTISEVISELASSPRMHYIEASSYGENKVSPLGEYGYSLANKGESIGTRVFVTLDNKPIEKGLITTRQTTLGHELKHAFDFDKGYYKGLFSDTSQYDILPTEISAVHFENRIRKLLNLPIRNTYGGKAIPKSKY